MKSLHLYQIRQPSHCTIANTTLNFLNMYWPKIWRVLFPTKFPTSTDKVGPKHSTSIPFSAVVAVTVITDENEVALVESNPAVKASPGPQLVLKLGLLCCRGHPVSPPSLHMVTPVLLPATVHLNVTVLLRQVGGAAVNCPPPPPAWSQMRLHHQVSHAPCKYIIGSKIYCVTTRLLLGWNLVPIISTNLEIMWLVHLHSAWTCITNKFSSSMQCICLKESWRGTGKFLKWLLENGLITWWPCGAHLWR